MKNNGYLVTGVLAVFALFVVFILWYLLSGPPTIYYTETFETNYGLTREEFNCAWHEGMVYVKCTNREGKIKIVLVTTKRLRWLESELFKSRR